MRGLNKLEYIKILVRYRNTAEIVCRITNYEMEGERQDVYLFTYIN